MRVRYGNSRQKKKMKCTATGGELIYRPSDKNKKPDAIDFFLTKDISTLNVIFNSRFDLLLSSDHSAVIFAIWLKEKSLLCLQNKYTNWCKFRE